MFKANQQGFSLLEVLFVMVLMTSLILIAVPKLSSVTAYIYLQAASHQLQRALNLARVEAITHNQTMLLCPRGSTLHCMKSWSRHLLIVSTDQSLKNTKKIDLPGPRLSLQYRGFPSSSLVRIEPTGLLSQQNGTFTLYYQDHSVRYQQQLIMSRTGRIRKTPIQSKSF